MSIYSVKLGSALSSGTGVISLFTAAAGVTTVIRDLIGVGAANPGPTNLGLDINGETIWSTGNLSFIQGYHLECRIVLLPGDTVDLHTFSGDGDMYVSGYTLA